MNSKAINSITEWAAGENVEKVYNEINDHIIKFATDTDLPVDDATRNFLFKLKVLNEKVVKPLFSQPGS